MQIPGKKLFNGLISFLSRLMQSFNAFVEHHPKTWKRAKFIFKYLLIPATVAAIIYFTGGLAALGSIPIVGGYISGGLASAGTAVASWISATAFNCSAGLATTVLGLTAIATLSAACVKGITLMVGCCRPNRSATRQEPSLRAEEAVGTHKEKRTCCSLSAIFKALGLKSSNIKRPPASQHFNETPPPISSTVSYNIPNEPPPGPTFNRDIGSPTP